jgi:hypothetical protein
MRKNIDDFFDDAGNLSEFELFGFCNLPPQNIVPTKPY